MGDTPFCISVWWSTMEIVLRDKPRGLQRLVQRSISKAITNNEKPCIINLKILPVMSDYLSGPTTLISHYSRPLHAACLLPASLPSDESLW